MSYLAEQRLPPRDAPGAWPCVECGHAKDRHRRYGVGTACTHRRYAVSIVGGVVELPTEPPATIDCTCEQFR